MGSGPFFSPQGKCEPENVPPFPPPPLPQTQGKCRVFKIYMHLKKYCGLSVHYFFVYAISLSACLSFSLPPPPPPGKVCACGWVEVAFVQQLNNECYLSLSVVNRIGNAAGGFWLERTPKILVCCFSFGFLPPPLSLGWRGGEWDTG